MTPETIDLDRAIVLLASGLPRADVAARLGTTWAAIYSKARKRGRADELAAAIGNRRATRWNIPAPSLPDLPRASCYGMDTELWFPDSGSGYKEHAAAKAICARCPERNPCLEYALLHEVDGIWGGTTPDQRKHIKSPTYTVRGNRKESA